MADSESHAADDAQIDLFTLASALMLTLMCLLLSQVLSEGARSDLNAETGAEERQITRLRLTLEVPSWESKDKRASLLDLQHHPTVASKLYLGTENAFGLMLPYAGRPWEAGDEALKLRAKIVATRKHEFNGNLGWKRIILDLESLDSVGDLEDRELYLAIVSPLSEKALGPEFATVLQKIERIGDAMEVDIAGREKLAVPANDPHGGIECEDINHSIATSRDITTRLFPTFHFPEGNQLTLCHGALFPLAGVGYAIPKGFETNSVDAAPPLVFWYRIRLKLSNPETERPIWQVNLLPTAERPGWKEQAKE